MFPNLKNIYIHTCITYKEIVINIKLQLEKPISNAVATAI